VEFAQRAIFVLLFKTSGLLLASKSGMNMMAAVVVNA